MVCGLTYTQITKHQKPLLNYLATETELHDQLSQPLCASAQDKAVEIQPADTEVPKISFGIDPDVMMHDDFFCDPAWDDIPEDEEIAKCLQELTDSGEIHCTSIRCHDSKKTGIDTSTEGVSNFRPVCCTQLSDSVGSATQKWHLCYIHSRWMHWRTAATGYQCQ